MIAKRWMLTFLGFPPAGLLAIETVGGIDGPASAAAAGVIAGTIIGAGQWLVLRAAGVSWHWVPATAAGLAAGSALASVVTDSGTSLAALMASGLIAGAAVGAAQATLLAGGSRAVLGWTAANSAAWSLGWLVTTGIGVDVERGYVVFGAAGAILATLITAFVLHRVLSERPVAIAGAGPAVA
jgi:hypothetical protein